MVKEFKTYTERIVIPAVAKAYPRFSKEKDLDKVLIKKDCQN